MPRYKKGDIVICVTDEMYGMKHSLKVGEQYRIDDYIEISFAKRVTGVEKNLVRVSDTKTGEYVNIFDDKHFIPLDVWREFQLRKVLE